MQDREEEQCSGLLPVAVTPLRPRRPPHKPDGTRALNCLRRKPERRPRLNGMAYAQRNAKTPLTCSEMLTCDRYNKKVKSCQELISPVQMPFTPLIPRHRYRNGEQLGHFPAPNLQITQWRCGAPWGWSRSAPLLLLRYNESTLPWWPSSKVSSLWPQVFCCI